MDTNIPQSNDITNKVIICIWSMHVQKTKNFLVLNNLNIISKFEEYAYYSDKGRIILYNLYQFYGNKSKQNKIKL